MTKLMVLCFVFLLINLPIQGQDFEVIISKKAVSAAGKKLRKGDKLKAEDNVTVKEGGILTLDINYPRKLTMESGTYRLDSLIEDLKYRYTVHKKHYANLQRKKLLNCNFAYKAYMVPGSNRHYIADRIIIGTHQFESTGSRSVLKVEWENPDKSYEGAYTIIIQESRGQELLVDVLETDNQNLTIPIHQYKEAFLHYHVSANDCRASEKRKIIGQL